MIPVSAMPMSCIGASILFKAIQLYEYRCVSASVRDPREGVGSYQFSYYIKNTFLYIIRSQVGKKLGQWLGHYPKITANNRLWRLMTSLCLL